MTTILFLLLAADPSGLSAALQTADRIEVQHLNKHRSITLQGPELKRLAKRVKCKGEARPYKEIPGVAIAAAFVFEIRVLDKEGHSIGEYFLINDTLRFEGKEVDLVNSELSEGIRVHFGDPTTPKPTFRPKVVNKLQTDAKMAALAVAPNGWILFGIERERNCLQVFLTGSAGSMLKRWNESVHDKLKSPHAIAATDRFVYLAGSNGIAGFRRSTPGRSDFEPSQFLPEQATTLHAADGKLYAARKSEIWVYDIMGKEGRLHFQETTLTHKLLHQPTGMASAKGHLYVVTAGGALLTFKDDTFVSAEMERREPEDSKLDHGQSRTSCLTVDGEKLYTVGIGEGLAVWNIAQGRPTLLMRVNNEEKDAKRMQSVRHVVAAGGRVWVSGYAGNLLAWFEWQDDELVYAGSADFGDIQSLVAGYSRPGSEQYVYAAGDNGVRIITTQLPFNSLPPPELP